jgi:hypothetical protein
MCKKSPQNGYSQGRAERCTLKHDGSARLENGEHFNSTNLLSIPNMQITLGDQ